MAPIRLALCITDLAPGGAERMLAALATRLDRSRFEPTVYCLAGPPEVGRDDLVRQLAGASIGTYVLGARQWWQLPFVLRRLRRMLRSQQAQVVQTFLFHANLVGRLAAPAAGRPRVLSGMRVADPCRWRLWADWLTDRLVDRHVCVSEAVARFAARVGSLPPGKLTVIPNGIDVERYPAAQPADLGCFGMAAGRRVLSCVGRLDRQKGVAWLLEMAPQVLGRLAGHDLLIVGDGPDAAGLERRVQALGLPQRVHFAGWRHDVPEILAASDLLLLPSRWEGMPNVVLEAMASGLPVVATDVEGVSELLGPGAPEQTAPWGDRDAFIARLLAIADDRELSARLGRENRRRAAAEFPLERMVPRLRNSVAVAPAGMKSAPQKKSSHDLGRCRSSKVGPWSKARDRACDEADFAREISA